MIYTTLAHWETRNNAAQRHRKCAEDARSAIAGPSPNNEAATPGGIKSRQRNAKQQEREDGAPQAVAEVSIQGAECLQTSAASRGHEQEIRRSALQTTKPLALTSKDVALPPYGR